MYLGTATWDECATYLNKNYKGYTKTVLLRENDTFNIETGLSDNKYIPINVDEMNRYISDHLSKITYPYQSQPMPDEKLLILDLEKSALIMKERMDRYGITSNFRIVLNVYSKLYQLYPNYQPLNMKGMLDNTLECTLDE